MAKQTPNTEEQKRFQKFLSRLRIFDRTQNLPIRSWMTWLGSALFIALVIAYYATGGGG